MEEYIQAARDRGLREIGFADHIPMYWLPENLRDPELAMSAAELPNYIEDVAYFREKYPDMVVKLGIEADYIPGREEELSKVLSCYNFDYVLGSIHYVDGWGFDNPAHIKKYEDWNIDELYHRYFHLVQQAALSGLFDIIAHPDLVKKFGYRPKGNLQELYRETARVFKRAGVYVEINTAGLRAPVGEVYPHPDLLRHCIEQGIKFTLGSDAHAPEQVGEGLDSVSSLVNAKHLARL
jgi:histidinol-phosphatase (PHP family)